MIILKTNIQETRKLQLFITHFGVIKGTELQSVWLNCNVDETSGLNVVSLLSV